MLFVFVYKREKVVNVKVGDMRGNSADVPIPGCSRQITYSILVLLFLVQRKMQLAENSRQNVDELEIKILVLGSPF